MIRTRPLYLWLLFAVAWLVCVLLAVRAQGCDYAWAENPEYARVVDQGGVVVVTAAWCQACQREKRSLETARVPFALVDLQRHPLTAAVLRVAGTIPQTIVIRNRCVVWRGGYATPEQVREAMK